MGKDGAQNSQNYFAKGFTMLREPHSLISRLTLTVVCLRISSMVLTKESPHRSMRQIESPEIRMQKCDQLIFD